MPRVQRLRAVLLRGPHHRLGLGDGERRRDDHRRPGEPEPLEQLAARPETLANNVKALKGPGGLKRLRVGDWRVIFTETLVVIAVERIASRGSAYD